MFAKKKKETRKSGGGKGQALMEQMGMFPDMMMGGNMDLDEEDDDDGDLEAELRALAGEGSPTKPRAKPAKGLNAQEFDKMVADSLKDYGSDEDLSDSEEADLMAELQGLTKDSQPRPPAPVSAPAPVASLPTPAPSSGGPSQVSLLEERLDMYRTAEETAKSSGESSKARRINRGVKTLQDLLKKAKAGKVISEDDIPPPVASSSSKSSSEKTSPENELPPTSAPAPQASLPAVFEPTITRPTISHDHPPVRPTVLETPKPAALAPTTSTTGQPAIERTLSSDASDPEKLRFLTTRRDQYKSAALAAKHSNDKATAVSHIKTAKQFDRVIEALQQGKPVDLSQMPPPPGSAPVVKQAVSQPTAPSVARSSMQASQQPSPQQPSPQEEMEIPKMSSAETQKLFNAPAVAASPLEALQQRLAKYQSSSNEAKEEGNNSKAKRMGRIAKQYEDAIKMFKAGKPVNFDDLPCPPGFPPIPGQATTPVGESTPSSNVAAEVQATINKPQAPAPPGPSAAVAASAGPQRPAERPKMSRQISAMSRAEQQTIFLQERQLQFRKAALQAKKNGDLELAKKYLRFAKGLDQMVNAAMSGLPVDMSQVPPAPNTGQEEKFEFVESSQTSGDREGMYKKLEQELIQQMKTCSANADNFTHLGDVGSATKFDRLRQDCMKDLDTLRNAYKHGDPVPRFHYENRQFSMVKCCADLGDNDLEINIIKGINYGLPTGYTSKDMDTYVKYEFPYPNENPQSGSTDTCKHTVMPEYNQCFKLQINRKSRAFQRILKSNKNLKFEVYYKRGFLKGDKMLGNVNVKLQSLENECVIHDCADLMDGRKTSGGKLEFKVRVRDPFLSKQVEEIKERWLIIDKFERSVKPQPQVQAQGQKLQNASRKSYPAPERPPPRPNNSSYTSMEVLKYEKQLLEQQIRRYQGKLNKAEEGSMRHKLDLIQGQIDETKKRLQAGGLPAYKAYVVAIEKSQADYLQEAKVLVQQGNKEKAQVLMHKKKCIEREVEAIRSKISV